MKSERNMDKIYSEKKMKKSTNARKNEKQQERMRSNR